MNIGGLMLILLIVGGAIGGMFIMASKMNMNAPVDSYGNTVSAQDNSSRMVVNGTANVGATAGSFIALIVGVLIMIGIIIFFVGTLKNGGSNSYRRG